jgi:hypothetical protein
MLDTTHDAPPRNRARTRVSLWCLPAWLAATLLLTWPLAPSFGRFIPTVLPLPDALLQAFLLHWDLRTLFTHPSRVWDAPIFHPERNTLTYTDHHLAEAVLVKPVTWLTSNTAVPYNVLIVLTFVASAWTMYRLGAAARRRPRRRVRRKPVVRVLPLSLVQHGEPEPAPHRVCSARGILRAAPRTLRPHARPRRLCADARRDELLQLVLRVLRRDGVRRGRAASGIRRPRASCVP